MDFKISSFICCVNLSLEQGFYPENIYTDSCTVKFQGQESEHFILQCLMLLHLTEVQQQDCITNRQQISIFPGYILVIW